jgi:hypothetical protein
MSSTHADAVVERIGPDAAPFASLPLPLAHRIFLALPADDRGRASCVCRAWRDALADPSLWSRLDMSLVRRFGTVLHGAVRRARRQLCRLEVSQHDLGRGPLLSLLTANAGSLRELHIESLYAQDYDAYLCSLFTTFDAVVAAAPLLQVLAAEEMYCKWEDAPRMLRAEPPFAPLQIRHRLVVEFAREDRRVGGMERFGPFAAALADAALQPVLKALSLWSLDTAQPAVMDALVDAALARRLRELKLYIYTPPAAAPLARLLAEGSLDVLEFHASPGDSPLFDAAGAALVADALRTNTTLTSLHLHSSHLCTDIRAGQSLLGALVGHPKLRELRISGEDITREGHAAFCAALAALTAADAPALHVLECSSNFSSMIHLGDAGLAPILQALPLNRHLRVLDLHSNGMSEAFARERLLPAVRANTSLQSLKCADYFSGPAAAEAEELVRRRAQHD